MLFLLKTNVIPIIAAGLMNGSFVIPARYIKSISNEKIWFYHSMIGLAIIPWILLALTSPGLIHNYLFLPLDTLTFLIVGGAIFGVGQVCFAYAIESLGIALSFAINLSIGVTIGSMFVVFYKSNFFTVQSYLVTFAVLLIICSLIIHYYAHKKNLGYNVTSSYHRGWILASLTGLTSGLQNIIFVIVAFHSKTQFQTTDSFWVWPPFLLAAAVPMLLGFSYKTRKETADKLCSSERLLDVKNMFLVTLMGLFFTGSLALYSCGMDQLTHQEQMAGWPVFMVSIIFASQMWGCVHGEANGTTKRSKFYMLCSVLLLVIAIIILAAKT